MMGSFLVGVLCALAVLVIIRTLRFVPKQAEPVTETPVSLDRDKIVADMRDMIRCKTVSYAQ